MSVIPWEVSKAPYENIRSLFIYCFYVLFCMTFHEILSFIFITIMCFSTSMLNVFLMSGRQKPELLNFWKYGSFNLRFINFYLSITLILQKQKSHHAIIINLTFLHFLLTLISFYFFQCCSWWNQLVNQNHKLVIHIAVFEHLSS